MHTMSRKHVYLYIFLSNFYNQLDLFIYNTFIKTKSPSILYIDTKPQRIHPNQLKD